MKHDGKVIELPTQPAPMQEVKIVLFQIVTTNSCTFLCLSEKEDNNKLEIGIIRR